MFKPVDPKFDIPAIERDTISFWNEHDVVSRYLHRNDESTERWSFLDGPITANGRMGVHHAWGRSFKDLWQRYHTMLGHKQRYQNGFDCQGLWVEVTVERELGFKSKRDIESFGIAEFVRRCKASAYAFADIQTAQSKRLGMFMDWDNSYFTLSDENNYTIWHFLKTCHEHGWLYKGTDVMPWCVRCGTGLSEHEINTTEYEEIVHTSVYVKFPLIDRQGESLLVWTTTPWTLTSNVAAAVNPDSDPQSGEEVVYVKVQSGSEFLYMARDVAVSLGLGSEIRESLSGQDLIGWRYVGPFDELPAQSNVEHRVIAWDQVSATEGTGIVHIAPGAGKEDFRLGKTESLPAIAPLDENGIYQDGFGWLSGRNVLEVAPDVVADLEHKGILFKAHQYTHRYPVCWRCQTQLVFRLVDEWFISMDELRERMIRAARQINWIPSWGLDRELDWLRNMDDWMISKKRYWGLALPIYECTECGKVDVIGGKEELERRSVDGIAGLESPHRPWIDEIKIRCSGCTAEVTRIKEVGNPWLDAGIVPFSTLGYVSSPEQWEQWFPVDFITESFPGQFRNWFYSLIAQSAALENINPFKTVLGYAVLRDIDGREMHKSWGNAIDFDEAADRAGADTMRWLFACHQPELNLHFGYLLLAGVKSQLLTLWNAYSFFVTYARIDGYSGTGNSLSPTDLHVLDQWIRARLRGVVAGVRDALDTYDNVMATGLLTDFIEDLSTWYIRRSRRRFWKSGSATDDDEKRSAYGTLHHVLIELTKLLAPFIPHIAEHMYQNLSRSGEVDAASVHLTDFPAVVQVAEDIAAIEAMATVRELVSLGRAAREQSRIKVRQPLSTAYVAVPTGQDAHLDPAHVELILEELNVKELQVVASGLEFIQYRIRPNLPALGRKYGRDVQRITAGLHSMDPDVVAGAAQSGSPIAVTFEDGSWELLPEEVLVEASRREGYASASNDGYLVALDTTLTDALLREGLARDFARWINEYRKAISLNIEDRISIVYQEASPRFQAALDVHDEFVKRETLAVSISPSTSGDGDWRQLMVDEDSIQAWVTKT